MDQPMVPDLYCPFPSAMSPFAAEIDEQTIVWAEAFHLLEAPSAAQHLRAASVGWLIARVNPSTSRDMLQLLADWSTWLLIWDDLCSESDLAVQPHTLARLGARYCRLLRDGLVPVDDPPLVMPLLDLRQRLIPLTTPAWRERFIGHVAAFFDACRWEAENRATGTTPDVATYMAMRPYTSGFYTYIELLEISDQIELPLEVKTHPVVERLTHMAATIVCWINDLISLGKELRQGDVHNLVLILQHQYKLALQAAIYRAVALHDAQMRAFLDLEMDLPSFGPEVDRELGRYIGSLHAWMRGSLDWSYNSGRYLAGRSSEAHAPQPTTTTFSHP